MPNNADKAADILLAEYNNLRTEIISRSSAQQSYINIYMAASGTIASLVLAQKAPVLVLITVPLLASSFALLYLDHAGGIHEIGRYIALDLSKKVDTLLGASGGKNGQPYFFEWEQAPALYEKTGRLIFLRFGTPFLLLFSVAPFVLSVFLAWELLRLGELWPWIVLSISMALQIVVFLLWLRIARTWFEKPSKS